MGEPPGEAVRHSVASVTAGNAVEGYEVVRQRKSGEPVTVAVWAVPLAVAEGETRCLSMGVDITARKRAEERIRFLAEASEVLASSLDYERTLEAVARLAVPAIASIAVVDGPRFDASAPLAVASEDPEHEELVREMRRRYPLRDVDTITLAMRTGEPRLYVHPPFERIRCFAVDEEHARMIARTGTRASMVVPLIARGQTLGVFSFASRDRLYDEQDLAFAVELARRAATAIDNARLYRELQEAVRIREDFLTAAGYELRTPITAIHLQLASVIRLARRGVPHDEIAQCAERATRSLDRLVRLSNDLLDISWLGDRKLAIEPTPTDLRQEVCEALARLRGELARAGCAVEFEARDPVRGHWDRLRLSQLIACILSNAMKYGAGRPIHIRVSREGVGARLTVQDQGIGIAPENQARIFNRFERADAPNHYGGLGMGLWIARQVVEAHGGTIRVESAPGRGALFQVDLPPGPEGTTPEAT